MGKAIFQEEKIGNSLWKEKEKVKFISNYGNHTQFLFVLLNEYYFKNTTIN